MRADDNTGKSFRITMTVVYTALIICMIAFVSLLVMKKTDDVLKSKVGSMTSALNVQMKMNMDSYLDRLESVGTLVFAVDEVYTYSASDKTAESYEAISTEDIISDELFDLCIMENFVDFGIVYSNGHTVGKISNGTSDLFGDRLYEDLSAMINRKKTSDGWAAGYSGDFKRIYYVKRVNENAVLVTSVYTTELEKVFDHPGGIDDITVRLADANGSIIYSSLGSDETGSALPEEISSRIGSSHSAAIMDDSYLVTVNRCGDDWKVICSVPTKIILKEKNDVKIFIIIVAAAASLAAFVLIALLSAKISDPVNRIVNSLSKKASTDQLTQLLNKKSFEERAAERLDKADTNEHFCAVLIDIDDFKGVNDGYGHAAGDKVLSNVGEVLRGLFKAPTLLGRLGGDEFCVFAQIPEGADSRQFMSECCTQICEAFRTNHADNDEKYKISASVGAACTADCHRVFQSLYTGADKALYTAKRSGKDTFSIFDPNE